MSVNTDFVRTALAFMGLICGTASAGAAEPVKWCNEDNRQTIVQLSLKSFVIDGKPIDGVSMEHTERYDGTDEAILVYKGRVFYACR